MDSIKEISLKNLLFLLRYREVLKPDQAVGIENNKTFYILFNNLKNVFPIDNILRTWQKKLFSSKKYSPQDVISKKYSTQKEIKYNSPL